MLQKYRFCSIHSKMIGSFLVLSLIPLSALALFSYQAYLKILQGNVRSYTGEVIDRIDRNLRIYLSDFDRVFQLRNDYYNLQFIKLSLAGDIEGNRKFTFRLWENLNNIKQLKTDLRDVSLITLDGVKIGCYGVARVEPSQHQLFQALAQRDPGEDGIAVWGPHPDWLGGKVFSVGKAIYGDYNNFLGIMCIDVEIALLERICRHNKLGQTGYVMLTDADGKIVYHPKPDLIGKPVSQLLGKHAVTQRQPGFLIPRRNNGNHIIIEKSIQPANWKVIGISNETELTREMHKVADFTFLLILGSIPVVVLVALLFTDLLTRPIRELQTSMRRAAEDLNTNVEIRTNDEIGQLGITFNQILAKIRLLMEQSVQEQKKLRRAEMMALQEQIKPHFIYNTLDLIIGMLETQQNEEVINMVEALGAFFRISLSHGQEMISIRDETQHVRNYLYLQKIRYGEHFNYNLEIEPAILQLRTIKLILQPLVENAISHGIRDLSHGEGLITVKGYRLTEDSICFEVTDNGKGMTVEQLAELQNCLHTDEPNQGHFGLRCVHERLVLAFGPKYGLELQTAAGGGITAKVRIPVVIRVQEGGDGSDWIVNGGRRTGDSSKTGQ
ncbi:MAG TPA: sensor histidine kinase [Bacillota bacterium]|nr:sensor histidine kinase [Bacillota bacterium]